MPLDRFEGGGGFFYNKEVSQVARLTLGEELKDFQAGNLKHQYSDFNPFIEWFFEL
jgi:hypothetical protein